MEKDFQTKLDEMKVGDMIKLDWWNIHRMPTGLVMSVDSGASVTIVFVPNVLNVETRIK